MHFTRVYFISIFSLYFVFRCFKFFIISFLGNIWYNLSRLFFQNRKHISFIIHYFLKFFFILFLFYFFFFFLFRNLFSLSFLKRRIFFFFFLIIFLFQLQNISIIGLEMMMLTETQ